MSRYNMHHNNQLCVIYTHAYHRDIGRHWPGSTCTVANYITGLGMICMAKMYVIPMEN